MATMQGYMAPTAPAMVANGANQGVLTYPVPPANEAQIDKGPAAACLFVAGMASDCGEAQLKALFDSLTKHGVLWAKMRKDRAERSYAFVQLRDVDDAIAMTHRAGDNSVVIGERSLRVQFANVPRTVMVCCVPPFFVRDDVLLAIGNAYGDVERIESVPTVANVGFIKFRYREDALLCAQTIAANPQFGWSAEIHNKILTQDNNNEPSHPTNNKPIRRNTNNKNHKNNNVNNTNNANSNVNNNNNNNNNNKSSASTNNNNTANGHTANGVDHKTDEVSIIDATDEPVAELSNSEKCQVFVGGIDPAHSNDTAIAALFARCGEVVSIAIKNNSVTDMRRDSFAFVRYKTPAEAETAIRELHGTLIGSKKIRVQPLEPATTKRLRKARQHVQTDAAVIERATVLTNNTMTRMATPPATPPHGVQHDGAAPTSPEQQQIQMMHGYAAPMPDGPAAPTAPQQHGAQYGGAGYDNAMAQYQYQYWFNAYAQYYARYPAAINAAQI